mmetsp:Transcript_14877/g.23061  ORF Transcript_14877/g.23061 Transcript_14877/m.23061 type:complete len:114 (+) Transcript_14877:49-390(+)
MAFFDSGLLITYFDPSDSETKEPTKFQCSSLENRDQAFNRIMSMWAAKAPEEVWKGNKSVLSSQGQTESEVDFGTKRAQTLKLGRPEKLSSTVKEGSKSETETARPEVGQDEV